MKNEIVSLTEQEVEKRIIELRGTKVLLDSDVAMLYGVETRVLKQAVRRNEERFPEGYMFKLSKNEFNGLRINKASQSVISFGGVQYEPFAFTEKGLYMLATILKSPKAVETSIAIIESFTKLREFSRNLSSFAQEDDSDKQKSILQRSSELLNDLLETDGDFTESESTVELNLAILKVKRTVKKRTKD